MTSAAIANLAALKARNPANDGGAAYFDCSVFVPEQHWPQHAPQAQLVVAVVVVSTVFAII